jgi:hypothetical protein
MARMARASTPRVMAISTSAFETRFELVPKDEPHTGARHWSIDDEPIGETWHDSSWMLRKGLDVIEELDLEPMHRDFGAALCGVTDIDVGTLSLVERE